MQRRCLRELFWGLVIRNHLCGEQCTSPFSTTRLEGYSTGSWSVQPRPDLQVTHRRTFVYRTVLGVRVAPCLAGLHGALLVIFACLATEEGLPLIRSVAEIFIRCCLAAVLTTYGRRCANHTDTVLKQRRCKFLLRAAAALFPRHRLRYSSHVLRWRCVRDSFQRHRNVALFAASLAML